MSDEHFSWSEWEAGAPIDEEHLKRCPECRGQVEALRFLEFQTDSAPRLEAPPFFASRVARLAGGEVGSPFWVLLGAAARRLIPAFAVLLLATTFLLYRSVQAPPPAESDLGVLAEPAEGGEDPSLDDIVVFLRGPEAEDESN